VKLTCWPDLYRTAEGHRISLAAFQARLRAPKEQRTKNAGPRWAGAVFRDNYCDLQHFIEASVIALDIDSGATRAQIVDAFGDFYGFAYTTWTAGHWLVGLVLDGPVTLVDEEHSRVLRAAIAHAEQHGLRPEYAQSAAHRFALPRLGGAPYEYVEFTGAFVDVAAALERFPKPAPPPKVDRQANDSRDRLLVRASRYLEKMPPAISGSGGHRATFAAACALVRGFGLEPDDALALLVEIHNPLCAPPWSLPELRHKIKQAHQRGRLPFGFLAERSRDGRAA
jgi:hypothetical protein